MNGQTQRLTYGRRLRNAAYWFITAIDDVLVERFWHPLRAGDARSAFRALAETLLGWWPCSVAAVVLIALLVLLLTL